MVLRVPRRSLADVLGVALAGLLAPKRLLPVALLVVALLVAQREFTGDGRMGMVLALSMALAAWFAGPMIWYGLLASENASFARALLYVWLVSIAVSAAGPGLAWLMGSPRTFLTQTPNFVVCWALALVGGWGLGRDIAFEERAASLERAAEQAQLLALKAHLDPHFLFNTLNAIAEWCREDGKVAEKAVLQLAGMLRSMLEGVRSPSWPLGRELELIDELLALHQLRDPNRYRTQRSIAPGLEKLPVPPFVFLPLVENAMKHGDPGDIALSLTAEKGRLHFSLTNPGEYKGPREGSDGLPTLRRRLTLAYGRSAAFAISSQSGRTVAVIDLPLQQEPA